MGKKIIPLEEMIDPSRLRYEKLGRSVLFENKSPKYADRIRSWAKNTQGEHLDNLVKAEISAALQEVLVLATNESNVNYYRGVIKGIMLVDERIKSLASDFINTNIDNDG